MTEQLYRIGEAARLLELETYVLRFWESEFPQLEPLRTPKGQRLYTATHLELLKRVKALLYEDGLTIEGARKVLTREGGDLESDEPGVNDEPLSILKEVRPAEPVRFARGTLLTRPPVSKDMAAQHLLQELRVELAAVLELARNPLEAPTPARPAGNALDNHTVFIYKWNKEDPPA